MKIIKQLHGIKPPTVLEIRRSRESFYGKDDDLPIKIVMDAVPIKDGWKGEGWHTEEIALGILVGLKIAKDREITKHL